MSKAKIEVVVPGSKILLGEGPHWVESTQELIYLDIPGKVLHRYVPATGKDYSVPTEGNPGFIIPIEGQKNKYLIGHNRDFQVVEWDGESSTITSQKTVASVEADLPKNRLNDGKCDPKGRLWAGTMGSEISPGHFEPEQGSLYRLDLDGKVTKHADKIGISNGLAWSLDNTKFFYNDSLKYTVDVFDYDIETGTPSNRRVLFDLKKNGIQGLPDGMCIDANNNLWVAVFGASKVIHIDSATGKLLDTIDFTGKASQITSVAFGGKNLDELYVTCGRLALTPEQSAAQSDAGALFKVTNLGVKGPSEGVTFKGKLAL